MLLLKCPRCGCETETIDAARELDIPCARCGLVLTPSLTPDAGNTELGISPIQVDSKIHSNLSAAITTEDQASDNETMTPSRPLRADTFPFLSPPAQGGDLGQLAHYRIVKLLGQGGMGIVFEAIDIHLERTVALKVMRPELAPDESALRRFLREARAMASVKSDHIATIHQVGVQNNVTFLAMELLHGEPLETWIERHKPARLEQLLRLGIEIGRGLLAAHEKGLIHRDIKPGNIWLEAPFGRVKILDFGLARTQERKNLTLKGLIMGTPAYMAPEQVEDKDVDGRCDLFSLGCILYELATGKQPFTGPTSLAVLRAVAETDPPAPRSLNRAVPRRLSDLIMKLLEKNPHNRLACASAVLEALEGIAVEQGVAAIIPFSGSHRPPSAAHAANKPVAEAKAREPFLSVRMLLGILIALVAILLGVVLTWQFWGGSP